MARGRHPEAGRNFTAALCEISRAGWANISRSKVQAHFDERGYRVFGKGRGPRVWPNVGQALRLFKSKGWVGRLKGGRYFLTRRGAKAARIACALQPHRRRR